MAPLPRERVVSAERFHEVVWISVDHFLLKVDCAELFQ